MRFGRNSHRAIARAATMVGLLLGGCQAASGGSADLASETAMRSACAERVASMYGVAIRKVELPPSFGIGDQGNRILNGQVDKGSEGYKEFRCIYDASSVLVDVMAMTPDGE